MAKKSESTTTETLTGLLGAICLEGLDRELCVQIHHQTPENANDSAMWVWRGGSSLAMPVFYCLAIDDATSDLVVSRKPMPQDVLIEDIDASFPWWRNSKITIQPIGDKRRKWFEEEMHRARFPHHYEEARP